MIRFILAIAVVHFCMSVAEGSFSPQKSDKRFFNKTVEGFGNGAGRDNSVAGRAQKDEYQITDITEIKVDGRQCRYNEVPKGAEITLLEVSSDNKSILRIHFQTRGASRR